MNHWIQPSCDSRTGASHRRRGAPCQDASGYAGFRDAAGTPIQVLVVSDGHGGARYVRSDVGARLACEVAMRELRQALSPARVADLGALEDWRRWFAEELPVRIVAAWLQEVESHWRADPGAGAAAFSPVVYGATLGVLLLTPCWWAHTGLGDWDLVRIESAGGEVLLSEEPEQDGAGEATHSLCLEHAERFFASRLALLPLTADTAPFALVLCSDGLRKSCASDEDFLTLCRYLEGLRPSADPAGSTELAEALDHISRQGSGDDISIAVGRWVAADQNAAWPPSGRSLHERLVQPASGEPIGFQEPEATAEALAPTAAAERAGEARDAQVQPGAAPAVAPRSPSSREAGSASTGSSPVAGRRAATSVRPGPRRRLVLWLVLLGLGGAGLLIAAVLWRGSLAGRREPSSLALTPRQRGDLQRHVAMLCGSAAVPGGGLEPGGEALERTTAASPGADATRGVTMDASQGSQGPAPPAAAGATASGAEPLQAEENAPASTSPAPRSDRTGMDASGTTSPRSGTAGAARGDSSPASPPVAGAAGTVRSGATAGARSFDSQRLQRITAILAKRDSVFQRLATGDSDAVAAASLQSQADPLRALIAYSATDRTLRPAAPPPERPGWWPSLGRQAAGLRPFAPRPGGSASAPASPLAALGACPELMQALHAAWQRHGASGPALRSAISPAASAAVGAVAAGGSATEARGLRQRRDGSPGRPDLPGP